MKRIHLLTTGIFSLLLLTIALNAQSESGTFKRPDWVQQDWDLRTSGSGTWIADNTKHQSGEEPAEAYGLKWTYGAGNSYLKGALFSITDGQRSEPIWEFREYWDGVAKELRVIQTGGDGTIGQGKITRQADGRLREEQTFVTPAGISFQTGHILWMEEHTQHTQSYVIQEGEWVKNRYYQWKLKE